jgi:putative phosphoesterase
MKIAVLSDTHVPSAAAELPADAYKILEKTDAIIHAGDYQVASVIDTLQSIAPFYGVCGNMDDHEISQRLPVRRIIQLGGFAVGVMHGWGSPAGLEDRIRVLFTDEKIDVLVYGHSHRVKNELQDGVLLFNPGSPTDSRFAQFKSMGVLTIEEKITGEIYYF